MAFTDTTIREVVAGSFTATGSSDSTFVYGGDVLISGTFDGTIRLEAQDRAGNWVGISDCEFVGSDLPNVKQFNLAITRPVRLTCTTFTSGTATYSLESIFTHEEAR